MAERTDGKDQLIGATSLDVLRHVIKLERNNISFLNSAHFNEYYMGGWNKLENAFIETKELDSIDPFSAIRPEYVFDCKFGIFSKTLEPDDEGRYLHFQMMELDVPKSDQAVTQITDMVKTNRLFRGNTWLLETDKSYQLIGSELIGEEEIYTLMGNLLTKHKGLLSDNAIAAILQNHGTAIRIPGVDFQNLESKVIKII